MTFHRLISAAVLACALSFSALSASAQGTSIAFGGLKHDSSLPIEITSDELNVDQGTGKAIFVGNVDIGQGSMRLVAGRVEVIYSQSGTSQIARLLATGGVTLTNGGEAVEAANAEYNLDSGSVNLSGNVLLTQGPNALAGERMTIDLNTGKGHIEGRVKTILQPGKSE